VICPHCKRDWAEHTGTLAGRLYALRVGHKLTQKDVAEILGGVVSTVNMIEKGIRNITSNQAILLSEYYSVSLDYILKGER